MARLLRLSTFDVRVLGLSCVLALLLIGAVALYGQATTPPALQSPSNLPTLNTWSPQTSPVNMATSPNPGWNPQPNTWSPQTSNFPSTGNSWNPPLGSIPGPYTRPTQEQTSWYVNNHPAFNNLDPGIKQAIIYGGAGSGLLSSPYLPNGNANPFYSSTGQTASNWYLPATWSSPNMNWQGVQPNGYLPTYSSTYSGYSPSSMNTSYNPGYGSTSYTPYHPSYTYNQPTYQQTQPQRTYGIPGMETANALRNTLPMSSTNRTPGQDFGRSVVDLKSAIEGRERALAVSQAAGDKVAQVSSHAELARLLIQAGKPEQAVVHIEAAEPLAKSPTDAQKRAELLRVKGSAYMATGDFGQAITAYKESVAAIRSQKGDLSPAGLFNRTSWYSESIGADTKNVGYSLSVFSEPVTDPNSRNRKNAEAEA